MIGAPDLLPAWTALPASAVAVAALEWVLRRWWLPAWQARGFTVAGFPSATSTGMRSVAALAASFAGPWLGLWQTGVTAALLAWLAVAASISDVMNHRIPREPCWAVLGAGTVLGLSGFTAAGFASAATAAIIVVVIVALLVAVTKGGIGSGDARLLLAFSSGAWWFGFTPTLIGLMVASLLQVLFRFVLFRHLKSEGGYPFAPALSLGYAAAVVLFGGPGVVCDEWLSMLTCHV